MSDTDTPGASAFSPEPDRERAIDVLSRLSSRGLRALVDVIEQQVAFDDHVPPRQTLAVISGDPPTVEIPCDRRGPCQWTHDGSGGVGCQTDGCGAWARPGMQLFDKVLAHIGPEA